MKELTTQFGAPVVNNQNIQTAGPRGPALLQDIWFLEKLAHFDREVIPEAEGLIGRDRESYQRDLFESIEAGHFPSWNLFIQVMPEADAASYRIHPFDLTKVWPHADYPLIEGWHDGVEPKSLELLC